MESSRKYYAVWRKYLSVVRLFLKKAKSAPQVVSLNETDFKATGNRVASGYAFNLEIVNGKVVNDITGTVVAVTLFEVLKDDQVCRRLINTGSVKISLGQDFTLRISKMSFEA